MEQSEKENFSKVAEETLLALAREGNRDAQDFILNQYKPLVKAKSRAFFLIGADKEDVIQEGMIGLYKAVRDYQPQKNVSFRVFAELCVNRQIITAIKAATRQKHIPLNSYISLNKPVFAQESEESYLDFLREGDFLNPESLFISQESKSFLESQIQKLLSDFETKVLLLYLQGRSYLEISKLTEKSEKSVDNALQRIKKKVEGFIVEKST